MLSTLPVRMALAMGYVFHNTSRARCRFTPRSVPGKAVSSMNALKSGIDAESQIIRGEDPEALQFLTASYYQSLQPTRPEEAVFVDAIISADWMLRRLRKTEAQTWNQSFQKQQDWEESNDQPDRLSGSRNAACGIVYLRH